MFCVRNLCNPAYGLKILREQALFFFAYAIIMWDSVQCYRVRTFSVFFCVRSLWRLCNSAITLLRRCIVGNLNLRTFSLLYELCAVKVGLEVWRLFE